MSSGLQNLTEEDALKFLVRYLRGGTKSEYSSYGYDLYLPNAMRELLKAITHDQRPDALIPHVSPLFYAAASELCRRGVLRPGVAVYGRSRYRSQPLYESVYPSPVTDPPSGLCSLTDFDFNEVLFDQVVAHPPHAVWLGAADDGLVEITIRVTIPEAKQDDD